jgi:glycine/D-amino acid oxidase-like deaminating enzyme
MARPWTDRPAPADRARYADARRVPYWLDALPPREPRPPAESVVDADLCIVGGGFTGLWAALHAIRADPGRDVVLLEGATIAFGASGRNGGFVEASLTHGRANGLARFADEMDVLERLGAENFTGMRADVEALEIDCDWREAGGCLVALEAHELAWLEELAELARRYGETPQVLDGPAMRAQIDSPAFLGGIWEHDGAALVDPARLAVGLADAVATRGVRIHERSPVRRLEPTDGAVEVVTDHARVRARRVLLATSAFPPLLGRMRAYIAPVYDYVLITEPLTEAQRAAIGWAAGMGVGDMGNQFHYTRPTADGRILFGGYDAVYRHGGPVSPRWDADGDATYARLSEHFAALFPQLADVRFSHAWGGAIDTCSRFSVFFGTAHAGRVAYALGYTGLGVAATRFGAQVALDLLDGRDTEATRLRYVRRKPVPFPPEPLRSAVIQLTRNRLAAADRSAGRRGLWLRTLDRFGLGFDS